ncbi:hypothetical protein EYF80_011002 [Liparis tanakae]|uniref:Uncharacterized protein n=1 Tax=Liparis tanakae TaxID=230148 RepID=A0A4Z2INM3_9TELE|nr:hypothetical protein EYF80_011002 [Liparis tanakae]
MDYVHSLHSGSSSVVSTVLSIKTFKTIKDERKESSRAALSGEHHLQHHQRQIWECLFGVGDAWVEVGGAQLERRLGVGAVGRLQLTGRLPAARRGCAAECALSAVLKPPGEPVVASAPSRHPAPPPPPPPSRDSTHELRRMPSGALAAQRRLAQRPRPE